MKFAIPFLVISATFASLNPFHLPKTPSEFSQSSSSGKALKKSASTQQAMLSGTQDANVVGFWVWDSSETIHDTVSTVPKDSIKTYTYHLREEVYLAANGSEDYRIRLVATSGDSADTIISRLVGNWATVGGMILSQITFQVTWISTTHNAPIDSVGGVDTAAYTFLGGGHSVLQSVSTTVDSILGDTTYDTTTVTKTGSTSNFTILAPTPIFAKSGAGIKSPANLTRFGSMLRYKNRTYRISGARENTQKIF